MSECTNNSISNNNSETDINTKEIINNNLNKNITIKTRIEWNSNGNLVKGSFSTTRLRQVNKYQIYSQFYNEIINRR